jgi:hypothetical protein
LSALDDLQAVVFKWADMNSSTIKPIFKQSGPSNWHRLQFVEDFSSVDDAGNSMPSANLDLCVKWVEEKLKTQPNCRRMAWDMWDFRDRRDAEKFITLFHLVWEQ